MNASTEEVCVGYILRDSPRMPPPKSGLPPPKRSARMSLEAVNSNGELFVVPAAFAYTFAVLKNVSDPQNFARAIDPSETSHQFCENWQGVHNVRFLEKVTPQGYVLEYDVIWGQPRHSMKEYYTSVSKKWPELLFVSFKETFCPAVAGRRRMKGFRVTKLTPGETVLRLKLRPTPARPTLSFPLNSSH